MNEKVVTSDLSKDGADWLRKYAHPPEGIAIRGIPDRNCSSSVVLDYKQEQNIGPPSGTGANIWSCLIVSSPNPEFPGYVIKWFGGPPASATDTTVTTLKNPTFNWGANANAWESAVARYRPAYFSVTAYLNAAQLYNQGKVFAGQFALEDTLKNNTPIEASLAINYYVADFPTAGTTILTMTDKPYNGHAKDGAFVPHSFSDPNLVYRSAAPLLQTFEGNLGGIADYKVLIGNTEELTVPYYVGMNSSYILFVGLLAQETIDLKHVHGYECLIEPNSIWSSFVTPGAEPDERAIERAFMLRYHMADAFPSANNDLGSIWSGIKSLAPAFKAAWEVAHPALRTAINAAVPGGGLINQVIDGLEGLLNEPGQSKVKKKKVPTATLR